MDVMRFLTETHYDALPQAVRLRAELCLLDLSGVAAGGRGTDLSRMIHDFAVAQMPGPHGLPLDGRGVSASGLALAFASTIDALDGHDGFNPAKGHIGCALWPGILALCCEGGVTDGREVLTAVVLGYEMGARLGPALHGSVPDYHTSGAWAAVAVAAVGARLFRLSPEQAAHAMGIAEYNGPRSQMMRCIDHPTMLKDGSGWGALAGVSAVLLARAGFTGAPAVTVGAPAEIWSDLGERWLILEQYFKPQPVCRWAQAPIEAVLRLRAEHQIRSEDVAEIEIATFHEATRLAASVPQTTEAAQYSTSFPTAVAMVHGAVRPEHLMGDGLRDPEVLRLSQATRMVEDAAANAAFPATRLARVTVVMKDGTRLESPPSGPRWDATEPPAEAELRAKYHALAGPVLGQRRADALEAALGALPQAGLDGLLPYLTPAVAAAGLPAEDKRSQILNPRLRHRAG